MNPSLKWGLLLGLPLVCCTCSGGVAMYGTTVYREEACQHFAALPAFEEKVGLPFERCTVDFGATLANSDVDTWHFAVKGPHGEARVRVQSHSELTGEEVFTAVSLEQNGVETLAEGVAPPPTK